MNSVNYEVMVLNFLLGLYRCTDVQLCVSILVEKGDRETIGNYTVYFLDQSFQWSTSFPKYQFIVSKCKFVYIQITHNNTIDILLYVYSFI